MPMRLRPCGCVGSRSRATRSISPCSRRSRRAMRRRSRPAKICFRRRTWKTSCASAACMRGATTSSRSTRHRPMASCNTPAPSQCSSATAGRAAHCFRTAAIRWRSPLPLVSGSAARNPIPAYSAPSAALPMTPSWTALSHAGGKAWHRIRGAIDALRHHARARRLMPSTRKVAGTDRRHRAGGSADFDGAAAPCATRSESAIVKLRPRGSCDGG